MIGPVGTCVNFLGCDIWLQAGFGKGAIFMKKDVKKDTSKEIDAAKRDTVSKLIKTAAFAAPVVATFAIDGKMNTSFALATNMTSS